MTIDGDVPVVATRSSVTWLSSPPVTLPLQVFNTVRSVAFDNSGRLLVVGERRVNGASEAAVQRYDGQSLDSSFGSGGTFGIDLDVIDIGWTSAFDSEGRVLVAVNSSSSPDAVKRAWLVRLTSSGALDTTFDGDGVRPIVWHGALFESDVILRSVFAAADNGVGVAGSVGALTADGETGPGLLLARFDANGAPDPSWGDGGIVTFRTGVVKRVDVRATAMAASANATYVLTPATFYGFGFRVVRFNAAGIRDTSYGGTHGVILGHDVRPYAIELDSVGRPVLLGYALERGWILIRLTTTGTLDATFGSDGQVVVPSTSDRPSGFTVDAFDRASVLVSRPATHALLRRFDASGEPDTSLGGTGSAVLAGVALSVGSRPNDYTAFDRDGSFIVAQNSSRLHRYRADGSIDTAFQNGVIFAGLFTIDSQGRPVVTTSTSFPTTISVARYTPTGAPDGSFTPTTLPPMTLATSHAASIATDSQDRILIAYTDAQRPHGARVTRIAVEGGIDPSFDDGRVTGPPSTNYWNTGVRVDGADRPLTLGWSYLINDAEVRRFESGTTPPPADTTPPSIVIGAPVEGASHQIGSTVHALYSCADDEGVSMCTGPVATGSPIDTSTLGPKTFTVTAADLAGNNSTRSVSYTVVASPPPSPPVEYASLTPHRLLDTRNAIGVASATRLSAGGQIDLHVTGLGGVPPTGADAVALNVTVTNVDSVGYLTLWPEGDERPTASSLNFARGDTVANSVIAKLGPSGRVSIWNSNDDRSFGAVDVIVDVVGWFPSTSLFESITPKRVLDTRVPIGVPQVRRVAAGETITLPFAGNGLPRNMSAVALNITAVAPHANGYLTVWPSGVDRPVASSVNFDAGKTVANMVIAKVGAGGEIRIWNSNDSTAMDSVDVIVDVVGWFTTGALFTAVTPTRALDTRVPIGIDVAHRVDAGHTVELSTSALAPPGATAVALNLTVTGGSAPGYLTMWPAGEPRPRASSINFASGQTVANLVIAKIGADGEVSIWNSVDASWMGPVHVLADIVGWF
jgi:uncharacterized delta-60 repeat protein